MGGRAGRGERKAGEGALDVSIRPGTVRFSMGKVVTVELVKGRKGEGSILLFLLFLLPGRYERNFFFGAGGRGSEMLRGLFSNPSWFLYLPLFVPEHHEKVSLFLPRGVVIFFYRFSRRFNWEDRVHIFQSN